MVAPLEGIVVVEVANYVAAPSAGALMRDLGAEVIKVEPPGGEVMRGVVPTGGESGMPFNFLFELENRGKKSVTLALDAPGAVEALHRLLAKADVFLTNLMGPRLEKFGLTPEAIHARNPRVIFAAVTGYGLAGRLDENGLIWAPMVDLPEVVAAPQLRMRGAFQPLDTKRGTYVTVGVPFIIRDADVRARGMASTAGADTAAVLAWAGFTDDEVADLAAGGALG